MKRRQWGWVCFLNPSATLCGAGKSNGRRRETDLATLAGDSVPRCGAFAQSTGLAPDAPPRANLSALFCHGNTISRERCRRGHGFEGRGVPVSGAALRPDQRSMIDHLPEGSLPNPSDRDMAARPLSQARSDLAAPRPGPMTRAPGPAKIATSMVNRLCRLAPNRNPGYNQTTDNSPVFAPREPLWRG